eukprot:scaffold8723_cov116-Isochrysis_galbana.AAC.3
MRGAVRCASTTGDSLGRPTISSCSMPRWKPLGQETATRTRPRRTRLEQDKIGSEPKIGCSEPMPIRLSPGKAGTGYVCAGGRQAPERAPTPGRCGWRLTAGVGSISG